jgi:hypothetical protein
MFPLVLVEDFFTQHSVGVRQDVPDESLIALLVIIIRRPDLVAILAAVQPNEH